MKGIRLKDEMINIKQILEAADIAFIYEEEKIAGKYLIA